MQNAINCRITSSVFIPSLPTPGPAICTSRVRPMCQLHSSSTAYTWTPSSSFSSPPEIPFPHNNWRLFKRMQIRSCHYSTKNLPMASYWFENKSQFPHMTIRYQLVSPSPTLSDTFLLVALHPCHISFCPAAHASLSGSLHSLHFYLNNLSPIFASLLGPWHKCSHLRKTFPIHPM